MGIERNKAMRLAKIPLAQRGKPKSITRKDLEEAQELADSFKKYLSGTYIDLVGRKMKSMKYHETDRDYWIFVIRALNKVVERCNSGMIKAAWDLVDTDESIVDDPEKLFETIYIWALMINDIE